MCGIVGAIAERNVTAILLAGLKRLEYRGYDSAGLAILDVKNKGTQRLRRVGKVDVLTEAVGSANIEGRMGIAHTRWATHGEPSEANAHPQMSTDRLSLVHNGIIENGDQLRISLEKQGYNFTSQTDTEVIVHLIHQQLLQGLDLVKAVQQVLPQLKGAYAFAVMDVEQSDRLVAARCGSPLIIGRGIGENFLASDQLALLPVTNRFVFLEDGDVAEISRESITLFDQHQRIVERPEREFSGNGEDAEKGDYRHFMLKEIHEQPVALQRTLAGRIANEEQLFQAFGENAKALLASIRHVQIIACGTSYHAGMVARYWIESQAGIPCQVEVASEFRYRRHVVPEDTLLVTISQSGETADTLAALRAAESDNYRARLAICNVASSSLVRESQRVLLTLAGPEIGVASTKAFTTQLSGLLLLSLALGRVHGLSSQQLNEELSALSRLPGLAEQILQLDAAISALAADFAEKHHTLFLGRGVLYPIAMEGALKLKEISYIHAEAYPAGELKHGPLALIDKDMPVVALAANDGLLEKLKSNLKEVHARGGQLYVFSAGDTELKDEPGVVIIRLPAVPALMSPILYTLPLQLLSYHVAVLRGTDVDQPRNLAKSVTVE